MTSIFKPLLAACFALATLAAHGQELKIGYVNLDRVLRESSPMKSAQSKLENDFGKREKDLVDSEQRHEANKRKFEREAMGMADAERGKRQRELFEQGQELQRKRTEYMDELNQRKNEVMASILERANKVLAQICEQDKYDFVLQEVLFASNRVDITDKVIKAMNAGSAK
jgi:outer membrane protein